MTCTLNAFEGHCWDPREDWQWVEARNEDWYLTNTAHGRGYDSKNLTLTLLDQALEIATEDREF